MSKKDFYSNLQSGYNSNAVSISGKTAIVMDDVTLSDIASFKFKIVGNNLVITNADSSKGLTLSDYSKLTSIKYGYVKEGNKESYRVVDLINNNLIDNTATTIKDYKKTSIVGATNYNDYIDASVSGYVSKSKNKGLTINGKKGSDTIIGTAYNDTITGGAGSNNLIYNSKNFGIDTVKLTKGETLKLLFQGELSGEDNIISCSVASNKKDLVVTSSLSDADKNKIILKNYYAKDLGATVLIDGYDLSKQALLTKITAKNYFEAGKKVIKSYKGSALADNIDASDLSKATNAKKGTGLSINGGAGYDKIIGSDFNDTLKGGSGNDTITGGKGNDNLYGVSGDNTFVFVSGDGSDTLNSGKGEDTVQFYGITLNDISVKTEKRNLVLTYGEGDRVTLKNYFDKKNKVVSSVKYIKTKEGIFSLEEFRNGTVVIPPEEETTVTVESLTSNIALQSGKNYNINSVVSGVTLTFDVENIDSVSVTQSGNDIVLKNGEDTVVLNGLAGQIKNISLKDASNNTKSVYTGNGEIVGSAGDDIIFNSTGNDTLKGQNGVNIYVFKKGDGTDHVSSTSGSDIIRFIDVNLSEIKPSTEDDKFYLKYSDNDRVYIDDFFKNQKDITVYTADKQYFSLKEDLGFIIGSGTINGDTEGNIIAGSNGNDTITAGKGNDKIIEYSGKNTYVFNKGDGYDRIYASGTDSHKDVLKFAGSTMSDLKLYKTNNNGLMINYNGGASTDTTNTVLINNYFDSSNKVTKFMLKDDDTIYSIDDDYINYVTAHSSVDGNGFKHYQGTYFNDSFTSKSGTDVFSGFEGKNVYNFSKGGGIDYIFSTSGKDTIVFSDVNVSDLTVEKDTSNNKTVAIYYNSGNRNDRIVLQDYLNDPLSIKIKGMNNSETNIQTLVTSQLGEVIIQNSQSAPNTFLYEELNSDVAQWISVTDGNIEIPEVVSTDNQIDLTAVFTNN